MLEKLRKKVVVFLLLIVVIGLCKGKANAQSIFFNEQNKFGFVNEEKSKFEFLNLIQEKNQFFPISTQTLFFQEKIESKKDEIVEPLMVPKNISPIVTEIPIITFPPVPELVKAEMVSSIYSVVTQSPVLDEKIEETKVLPTQKPKEYMYSNGYVRVRKNDSKKSAEVFLLKPKEKVEILERNGKSIKIEFKNEIGYVINSKLLSTTKKEANEVLEKKSKGKFFITGYCSCRKCSDSWGKRTYSGKKVKANHTVAADLSVFPLDTELYIEGKGRYVVEDVGGAVKGNHIDIYVEKHNQCFDITARDVSVIEIEG